MLCCDVKGELSVAGSVKLFGYRFDLPFAVVGAAIEAGLYRLSDLTIDDDGDGTGGEDVEAAMEDGVFADGEPVAWVGRLS